MINGIIAVHKPEGISSAHLVARLKKILGYKKIGHTGTLDPFASGLMLCGINQGTRLSRFFLNGSKTYRARLKLGCETDSQDITGKVLSDIPPDSLSVDHEDIIQVIHSFLGRQEQTPPAFSALKHKGKPLYEYARQGKPVIKPPRLIEVFNIQILDIKLPSVDIEVFCSSGTYIRTLGHDIGRKLGCGACLSQLCRTGSCGFDLASAHELDALDGMGRESAREHIIPMAEAVSFLPALIVGPGLEKKVSFGQRLGLNELPAHELCTDTAVRVLSEDGELIAIMEYDDDAHGYNYSCVFPN